MQLTEGVDISSMLMGIQDVTEVAKEGQAYKIKLTKTETAIPAIVEIVTKKGFKISNLTLAKPTLDQVFLQITGNNMRDGTANGDSYGQKVLLERLK